MPERSTHAHVAVNPKLDSEDPPTPEVAEFIRFCHRRSQAVWPEMYDVMCAVAAHREFRGWGPEQLAERGITFALPAMPRLAAWVRETIAAGIDPLESGVSAPAGA